MVAVVVLLAVAALAVAVWGLSKFSKWLERVNVPAKVFYPVMGVLMLIVGGAFVAAINVANNFV